jgi:hypothetical protein
MSAPVSTISWQGARETVRGFIAITVAAAAAVLQRLAPAAGRLGLAQEGQRLADLAQLVRRAVHAPGDPLDRAEEVDQHRHGIGPTTFSNRTAGPPSASSRVWISVISSTGETGAATRTRRPSRSSRAR